VVMGRLIGLPDEMVPVCRELTDRFMRQIGAHAVDGPAVQSYEIFQELIDRRSAEPRDDLMSAFYSTVIVTSVGCSSTIRRWRATPSTRCCVWRRPPTHRPA